MNQERRSYRQFCGLARALDAVGERWTLLIVRNLLLGPQRYVDLQAGLPGITTNLLARRLKDMQAAGLVERVHAPAPTPARLYALTERGRALEPAILALGGWGSADLSDGPRPDDILELDWAMVSLKRRYAPCEASRVRLQVDDRSYGLLLGGPRLEVQRGGSADADLEVRTDTGSLRRLLFRGASLGQLERDGYVETRGTRAHLRTFRRSLALTR